MKHLLMAIAVLIALPLNARERTADEKMALAQGKLSKTLKRKAPAKTGRVLKLLQEQEELTIYGYADGGYVLIANDDQFSPVLGYSDGEFDPSNLSPTFVWYTGVLTQQMKKAKAEGAGNIYAPRQADAISTLVQTRWSQGTPYNNLCPTYNGTHTLTGCVATALAQILNYHQLPVSWSGSKSYTYTDEGGTDQTLSMDFSTLEIDWEHMLKRYSGGVYSTTQATAVATLMYACGVLTEMTYSTQGSGATISDVVNGVNSHLDGLHARICDVNFDRMYAELEEGRPILYTGSNDEGGHAFVVDGTDADGLLHCNLGWGGSSDDYYVITDMAGFNSYTSVAFIYPDDEDYYTPWYRTKEEFVADGHDADAWPLSDSDSVCTFTYAQFFEGDDDEPIPVYYRLNTEYPDWAQFRFDNWGGGATFIVNYNVNTNECWAEHQYIGYTHDEYGPIYVSDAVQYTSTYSYDEYPCTYNKRLGKLTLNVVYYCDGGYFGIGPETCQMRSMGRTLIDPETGINNVSATLTNDGYYYDLNGRRVESGPRGIYIRNGRKVLATPDRATP